MKKIQTLIIYILPWLICSPVLLKGQSYSGDIEVYIAAFIDDLPGSNGNDFSPPDEAALETWESMLKQLMHDSLEQARTLAEQLNYQVVEFEDISTNPVSHYYVIEEKDAHLHNWGTYLLNKTPGRGQLVIQSPHPIYDTNTGLQGVFCFKHLGARGFLISGTHRCNHSSFSSCSGSTSACSSSSEPYRISDNAHNTNSIFQKTTEVFAEIYSESVFVQLHGFAKQVSDPYLIMSNGTRDTPEPDYIKMISDELIRIDNTLTSKIAHLDLSWSRLVAFTNTQGRMLNGALFPCTQNATVASGRFIHIEQERTKLRKDFIGWYKMYEALANTFPETQTAMEDEDARSGGLRVGIFPNPVNTILKVHTDGPFSMELYNLNGMLVKQVAGQYDYAELNLENEQAGIYILKVTSQQGSNTTRIMHY